MKKHLFLVLVIALVLVAALCGCRAINRAPGVTAVQSAVATIMPTLPTATLYPTTSATAILPSASVTSRLTPLPSGTVAATATTKK